MAVAQKLTVISEEGARFPSMAVASGVWAGAIPIETAWDLREIPRAGLKERKTMKEELTRIGFLGTVPASYDQNPFAAHFELHIEQGPVLEEESRKIGVVQGKLYTFDIARFQALTCQRCSSVQVVRNKCVW